MGDALHWDDAQDAKLRAQYASCSTGAAFILGSAPCLAAAQKQFCAAFVPTAASPALFKTL